MTWHNTCKRDVLGNDCIIKGNISRLIIGMAMFGLFTLHSSFSFAQTPKTCWFQKKTSRYVFNEDTIAYEKQLSVGFGLGNFVETITTSAINKSYKDNDIFFVCDINLRQTLTPVLALQLEYFRYRNSDHYSTGFNYFDHRVNMGKLKILFSREHNLKANSFYEFGFVGLWYESLTTKSYERKDLIGGRFLKRNTSIQAAHGIGINSSVNVKMGKAMLRLELEVGQLFNQKDLEVGLQPGIGVQGGIYMNADIELYFPLYKFKSTKKATN